MNQENGSILLFYFFIVMNFFCINKSNYIFETPFELSSTKKISKAQGPCNALGI